ncbi:MAG: hypothetical protein ABJ275_10295 [Maricaulaceae bacterium]
MKYVSMISHMLLGLTLGLSACKSSEKITTQVNIEFLPSDKDQVSKLLSTNLKSWLSSSGSYIFNPNSEKFTCAAELVDRQILADVEELLDYKIEPSRHRVFLSVTGRKTYLFASVRIVKPNELNGSFEPLVGLEYQFKDGCDSILSVRRDDY